MPGNDRTGSGASTARSTPAGTSITPRGLASADATFATTLLVAMPALAGSPSSPSIAPVEIEDRALDGGVAALRHRGGRRDVRSRRSRGTSRRCWPPARWANSAARSRGRDRRRCRRCRRGSAGRSRRAPACPPRSATSPTSRPAGAPRSWRPSRRRGVPGWPPTTTGLPSSVGSRTRSTETKNVSRSRQQIRGCAQRPRPRDLRRRRHERTVA